jgi:nucleoid-associated protein YgaU
VVSLPINFLGREFAEAELRVDEPKDDDLKIPLHFNPSEYKISKENTFAEIPIPGLNAPPVQFIRGGAQVLTLDALVDTSDELKSVEDKYIHSLREAMLKHTKLHAPRILVFAWGEKPLFRGVMQSLDVTYLLFHTDGTPLRAKLAIKLKEYRLSVNGGAPKLLDDSETKPNPYEEGTSPDVEKRYVVRTGETLSSIAGAVYRDPGRWREVAVANRITDPRTLAPGTVLTVPRLEGVRR